LTGYGDHRWSSTGSGQGTNSDGVDAIHRLARGARAAFLSQVNTGVLMVVIVEAADGSARRIPTSPPIDRPTR
jgi:hypothetical protein